MTTNRYTLDGKQYSPDMELAREKCPTCGTTHMVSYRVVEVTEQQSGGGFLWKTPENEGQLRIIMTSSMDNSGGQEAVAYAPPSAGTAFGRTASPYARPATPNVRRAVTISSPPVWVDETVADAPDSTWRTLAGTDSPDIADVSMPTELTYLAGMRGTSVQAQLTATPYNDTTGEDYVSLTTEGAPVYQDSVGSATGRAISSRLDAVVRDANASLRTYSGRSVR